MFTLISSVLVAVAIEVAVFLVVVVVVALVVVVVAVVVSSGRCSVQVLLFSISNPFYSCKFQLNTLIHS